MYNPKYLHPTTHTQKKIFLNHGNVFTGKYFQFLETDENVCQKMFLVLLCNRNDCMTKKSAFYHTPSPSHMLSCIFFFLFFLSFPICLLMVVIT